MIDRLFGQRIPTLYRAADLITTLLMRQAAQGLDLVYRVREISILNGFSYSLRIIPSAQVKKPSLLIHTPRYMTEHTKVRSG